MKYKKYNHVEIEKKWQKFWEDNKTFQCSIDFDKQKYYVLDMFPYPSGSGLHVGHVVGYTGSDVISRYKRQKGFNVLHPMGWDSFGLPAEQYAIRNGTHPQITTEININTYREQLKSLGFSYDWSREFATSDAKYYKWTQWIFTKLYEKGLAYQAEVVVNFCPKLGTVLANEEVEDGKSIEGGFPIERKPLRQWMLKITEYAQNLLDDLDLIDWPEHLKKLQRNWIGKSQGVNVKFKVEDSDEEIVCYTTRPDTLFGATYVVLSPEHHLLMKITKKQCRKAVENYQRQCISKSDLDRTDLCKIKTGVATGAYLINPINDEKLPIWVADYVLTTYGTGALMAVPAHDERDLEFSKIYNIPIKVVIDEQGNYINSTNDKVDLSNCTIDEAKENVAIFLEKIGCGEKKTNYKLRDWLFSRQRYWGEPFPLLRFEDGSIRLLELDELPLTPPMIEDYKPSPDGESPLKKVNNWVEIIDQKTGKKAFRETNTMPQWAGSCWYYLRFCDPHNEDNAWSSNSEKYWMPVDLYIGGVEHAVLHLLYARFWHKVLYDIGYVSTKEPFLLLRNQGLITSRSYKLQGGGYVHENDIEEDGGRLIQKSTGLEVISLIEKMSKSKLNGVSPDEIIEEYGADSLRLYVLFMAPFDKEKIWSTESVSGCKRFLNRVYELVISNKINELDTDNGWSLINKLIKDVESDLESLSFNTAIAKMMEFLNDFSLIDNYSIESLKKFIQLIYPFAPHFGEECWELLGGTGSIAYYPFPIYDDKSFATDSVTVIFQVMGKLRSKGQFLKGTTEQEVLDFAKKDPKITKYISGGIKKIIFVQDKLLNLVI